MKAADVMTRDVRTVGPATPVAEAIRLMLDNKISGLPVLDDAGKLVGIITEGDLLRRSEMGTERHRPRWLEILMGPGRMAGEYVRAHGRKVEGIMTTDLVSVAADTPLDEVVGLMERRRIKRVPASGHPFCRPWRGLRLSESLKPTAYAVGYILSPLPGLVGSAGDPFLRQRSFDLWLTQRATICGPCWDWSRAQASRLSGSAL